MMGLQYDGKGVLISFKLVYPASLRGIYLACLLVTFKSVKKKED